MNQSSSLPGLSGNQLKIIALIAMTIDHIGLQFLPHVTILRIIGRLAFPIFAYMIAEGCLHTRNRRRYGCQFRAKLTYYGNNTSRRYGKSANSKNIHSPKTPLSVENKELISPASNSITIITPATITNVACSSRPLFCKIWQATLTTMPIPAIFNINEIPNSLFPFYKRIIAAASPISKQTDFMLFCFCRIVTARSLFSSAIRLLHSSSILS